MAAATCRRHDVYWVMSMDNAAFRLSRIYAEGWNSASELRPSETDELEPGNIAALNPYSTEPEMSRWRDGFTKAIWSF